MYIIIKGVNEFQSQDANIHIGYLNIFEFLDNKSNKDICCGLFDDIHVLTHFHLCN